MLKIVALYLCWTIFLVSGDGNKTALLSPNSSSAVNVPISADGAKTPIEPSTNPPPLTTVPTTTTIKPTTTPKPTTTSKPPPPPPPPAPNTTTTQAPQTTMPTPTTTQGPTPAPTPLPPPKMGQWIVNGTNSTVCIVVKMAVEFNITYLAKDNKTKHYVMNLPDAKNATVVSGDCGAAEQTLNITWNGGNDSLVLHFVKNDTKKNYYMHHVQVILAASDIPDIKSNETLQFIHEANEFSTGFSNSYRCLKSQALSLKSVSSNSTMTISDLQFQAFKTDKATNFGQAQDCSPDVPDVVPIAVGCALTILVIIVLAAYLIGRRRNQARGYLSM